MSREKPEKIKKSFWKKIKDASAKAGRELIEKSLILYYCMMDDDTPDWARAVIVSALTYFISPVDAYPDFLPGGYADDLAVIAGAIIAIGAHIKDEHKQKAKEQVDRLFGGSETDEGPEPAPAV